VETAGGDLVGPGPGVVEPSLVSAPRVSYPPVARQQRITGKVVVLVLVNEEGAVTDAKLQQGIRARVGINEAVLEAIRLAKFRPATKNGVPVKMWHTVIVDVKP
jgi:protein TonB